MFFCCDGDGITAPFFWLHYRLYYTCQNEHTETLYLCVIISVRVMNYLLYIVQNRQSGREIDWHFSCANDVASQDHPMPASRWHSRTTADRTQKFSTKGDTWKEPQWITHISWHVVAKKDLKVTVLSTNMNLTQKILQHYIRWMRIYELVASFLLSANLQKPISMLGLLADCLTTKLQSSATAPPWKGEALLWDITFKSDELQDRMTPRFIF